VTVDEGADVKAEVGAGASSSALPLLEPVDSCGATVIKAFGLRATGSLGSVSGTNVLEAWRDMNTARGETMDSGAAWTGIGMGTAGGGGGSIQKERSIGASDTASVTETSLTSAYASRTSHQHVPTKSCARYSMSCDNSASSTAGATGLGCGARKDTITVEGRVQIKSHRRHWRHTLTFA